MLNNGFDFGMDILFGIERDAKEFGNVLGDVIKSMMAETEDKTKDNKKESEYEKKQCVSDCKCGGCKECKSDTSCVPEIVFCKECIHRDGNGYCQYHYDEKTLDTDFCSHAVRKKRITLTEEQYDILDCLYTLGFTRLIKNENKYMGNCVFGNAVSGYISLYEEQFKCLDSLFDGETLDIEDILDENEYEIIME